MAILLNNSGSDNSKWEVALAELLADMPVYTYPNIPHPEEIKYAVVWNHPQGDLKTYKNLRCVLSLAAGMEHLMNDPNLPDVPMVSLGDPAMSRDMANYALYWVMDSHRNYNQYREQQEKQHWERLETPMTSEFSVLVLGLGRIATQVAKTIQQAGFDTKSWDFKAKEAEGLDTYSGEAALSYLLPKADVVISCLALNNNSQQLIDSKFLSQMKPNSSIINISRGGIINEEALLTALNMDHLSRAVLDVFAVEPLPEGHELWTHPKVRVTPHMSGPTNARSAAKVIVGNIQRLEYGQQPEPIFDRSRGKQA
jgi:glyoxylate/hydroxypyruvate reductase A